MAAAAFLDFFMNAYKMPFVILEGESYPGFKFDENLSTYSKVTTVFRTRDFGCDFSIWGLLLGVIISK